MGVVLTVTNFLDALALAFTNEIHIRYMSLELALVEFGGSNAFAGLKSKSRDEIHTKWDKSNSPCSHLINWFGSINNAAIYSKHIELYGCFLFPVSFL